MVDQFSVKKLFETYFNFFFFGFLQMFIIFVDVRIFGDFRNFWGFSQLCLLGLSLSSPGIQYRYISLRSTITSTYFGAVLCKA